MDFGLRGRTAIVCAASMGLGRSCATALGGEGVKLVVVARRREILERAAGEIRSATGTETVAVVADVTTKEGRDAILAACPNPDILINNAGGPPAGDFRNWDRSDWIKALDANMLAPIELMKSTIDGMIARRFGRIVNITSHAVKAPIAMLGLSNGARSGLTGFVAGLLATNTKRPVEEVTQDIRSSNPSRRFGRPEEFGATCAFLCSAQAGYITGQNILIDGGSYPGTF